MTTVTHTAVLERRTAEDRYPVLGFIPRTGPGRVFLCWAAANVVLALLPVFDIWGNSAEIGLLGMPTTIFYSYAVFSLNCILGAVYYATRGLVWVKMAEDTERGEKQ